jgi:pimeloyl-ACP methyl ester carboxylesterase
MRKNGKRAAVLTLLAAVGASEGASAQAVSPADAPQFDPEYSAGEARPIAGGAAFYVEQGEGEPVVFFMHGFDQRYWQFQLQAFAADYRVIALWTPIGAPPPPGGGPPASPAGDGPVLPGPLAASVPAVLEAISAEIGVRRFHVVTHSIGGRMLLEVAAVRPELFASLTLLEPAGGAGTLPPPAPSCTLEGVEPVELEQCVFTNIFSGPGYYEALSAPLRALLVEDRRKNNAFIASLPGAGITDDPTDAAAASAMFFPICEEISALPMPLLFIRGANSTPFLQSGLDYYEQCLPTHQTAVIEGAAHNAHIERPAAFNAAVEMFLAAYAQ